MPAVRSIDCGAIADDVGRAVMPVTDAAAIRASVVLIMVVLLYYYIKAGRGTAQPDDVSSLSLENRDLISIPWK